MNFSIPFISLPVPPFTLSVVSRPIWLPNLSIETMRSSKKKQFVASSSSDDSADMKETFWITGLNDDFLADVVTKTRKYHSAMAAKLNVTVAIRKQGAKVAEEDPLWAELVAESKLVQKLMSEAIEAEQKYILHRQMTEKDYVNTMTELEDYGKKYSTVVAEWWIKYEYKLFENSLRYGEGDFWISGLEDAFFADVVTAKRKLHSAMIAKLYVDATVRKLGAEVTENDPLWADLLAESEILEELKLEFHFSMLNYMIKKMGKGVPFEAYEEKMFKFIMALDESGQMYTAVVAEWIIKYGARMFEVDDAN